MVVLTKDGSFITVDKSLAKNLDIGEEITIPSSTGFFQQVLSKKWAVSVVAAACFVLMISILFGYFMFSDEAVYAYVHIDINPSLELGLNKQLEVVKVTGLNKEGETLLLFYKYQPGEKLEKVTIQLLELAMEQGYFTENNDVLISTSLPEEREEYVQAINTALDQVNTYVQQGASSVVVAQEVGSNQDNPTAQQSLGVNTARLAETTFQETENPTKPKIAIHRLQTDEQIRMEAKEKGISPGKYTLFLRAKEKGLVTDLEEMKHKSVAELAKEIGEPGSIRSISGKRQEQMNEKGKEKEQVSKQVNEEKKVRETEKKKERVIEKKRKEEESTRKNLHKQELNGKEWAKEKVKEKEQKRNGWEKNQETHWRKQQREEKRPPGQVKQQKEDRLPPGQAKKHKEERHPPGQTKQQHGKFFEGSKE